LFKEFFQIPVGRGDQPDVGAQAFGAAHP
jgi:hypothetical protein